MAGTPPAPETTESTGITRLVESSSSSSEKPSAGKESSPAKINDSEKQILTEKTSPLDDTSPIENTSPVEKGTTPEKTTSRKRPTKDAESSKRDPKIEPRNYEEWSKSTFISYEGNTMTMKSYLQTMKEWWQDEHLDYTYRVLEQEFSTSISDVHFATRYEGDLLHALATKEKDTLAPGKVPEDAGWSIQEAYKDTLNQLSAKRFVVIPVNNAYGVYGEVVTDAKSGVREERGHKSEHGLGAHWAFIVVDVESRIARLIDPLVRTRKGKKGQDVPVSFANTGSIAGKILRGFDQLVLPDHQQEFSTSTLMWTPHQAEDNSARDSGGACGPYVYRFLEYLLQNKHFMTGEGGLEAAFDKKKQNHHKRHLAFNSDASRKKLRGKLWEERKVFDAGGNGPRMNLTPEVLKELNITPEGCQAFMAASASSIPTPPSISRSTSKNKDGDDFSDPDDDVDPDKERQAFEKPKDPQWIRYREALKNKSIPDDMTFPEYQEAEEAENTRSDVLVESKRDEKAGSMGPPTSIAEDDADTLDLKSESIHYNRTVNFTHIPESEINRWVKSSHSLFGQMLTQGMHEWDKKAILQVVFGGGFGSLDYDDMKHWKAGYVYVKRDWSDEEAKAELDLRVELSSMGRDPDRRGRWSCYPKGPWDAHENEYQAYRDKEKK